MYNQLCALRRFALSCLALRHFALRSDITMTSWRSFTAIQYYRLKTKFIQENFFQKVAFGFKTRLKNGYVKMLQKSSWQLYHKSHFALRFYKNAKICPACVREIF